MLQLVEFILLEMITFFENYNTVIGLCLSIFTISIVYACSRIENENIKRDSSMTQLYKLMVAGGIAGVLSWIISFPLDVIKSRMQAGIYLSN